MEKNIFTLALFLSVNHAMQAEKVCKEAGISARLIPIPRSLSSDCGVCLRCLRGDAPAVVELLNSRNVPHEKIVDYD